MLFDVDGTLVNSNDAHAHAWVDAFDAFGITMDLRRVRRCIGMGADKLMPEAAGIEEDSPVGRRISQLRGEIFKTKYLPYLRPFPKAGELVAAIKARGVTAVAASSAKEDELSALLTIAGAESLLDAATSSDDAKNSKPDPDIVQAALQKAHADPKNAVLIGDTPYDLKAASGAGVDCIAFRCGGWHDRDLVGAVAIYDGPWHLLERLHEVPLSRGFGL